MSNLMTAVIIGKQCLRQSFKWKRFQYPLTIKRNFLSPSYACEDAWNLQKNECETLKHITPDRYFFELNQKYQKKQLVSPIDVDIYVNSIYKEENQEELEHIIRRFRSTKLTVNTLESTHHAVFRFYFSNHKFDRLIEILNKRVEYGIFLDVYCYNMLLDAVLKNSTIDNAFEIVKILMLQEYSGNEITKSLSFLTLQKVFEQGLFGAIKRDSKETNEQASQENEDETKAEEDDDEIEYIRVPFLTNPFFDDHFDLTDKVKIWGKSLYFFGYELGLSGQSILSDNAKILGLTAFEKYDKLERILEKLGKNVEVLPETLEFVQIKLDAINESKKTEENNEKNMKREKCLQIVKNFKHAPNGTTFRSLSNEMLNNISEFEKIDIEKQMEIFKEFEETRFNGIKQQLDAILHKQKLQDIEAKKKELEQKKRLYYFFENFDKHEIDFVEAERRIKEIQENTVVDENYIPPEDYKR